MLVKNSKVMTKRDESVFNCEGLRRSATLMEQSTEDALNGSMYSKDGLRRSVRILSAEKRGIKRKSDSPDPPKKPRCLEVYLRPPLKPTPIPPWLPEYPNFSGVNHMSVSAASMAEVNINSQRVLLVVDSVTSESIIPYWSAEALGLCDRLKPITNVYLRS